MALLTACAGADGATPHKKPPPAAKASPNTDTATGGINRAFKYIYQIRVVGKRLKAWDKRVYYLVKWAIFGGLALWIFW